MDFLSRLIGGVGASQARKTSANNPQQRLSRFKRTYGQALQAWNKLSSSRHHPQATEVIRASLQRLTNILHDDSRAPAPHLCLSFAASAQIYITISQITLSLRNEDIVREAVGWFNALIDSDEENLLGNERFAETLMTFVDGVIGPTGPSIGPQTEGEILELTFGIAAKIRLEPDLLPVWFTPESGATIASEEDDKADSTALASRTRTFPLGHQFTSHVYHEGRAGDFARTGLLYIFESASNSPELEEWIVNSELPTLMASGLGALYSQLSRKLSIIHREEDMPLVLGLSDYKPRKDEQSDVESFYSDDLQSRLNSFMSNLIFWQDILEHCRSREIKQTLIDHFQVFFLQQILYPSLLESSDIDGGSSVAVLTYLWRILDSLDHPDLIHLILHYLLALSDPLASRPGTSGPPLAEKRKRSLMSMAQVDGSGDRLNPSFFNLVDLIQNSVQSINKETVTAALRLVSVIQSKHHRHALSSLIRISTFRPMSADRQIGVLEPEIGQYMDAARGIGGIEGIDESYDDCLRDCLGLIETHDCSHVHHSVGFGHGLEGMARSLVLNSSSKNIYPHSLLTDDSLLLALLSLLTTFLTNDIEANLGLTSTIAQLASCPYTSLEGWLAFDPSKYEFEAPAGNQSSAETALEETDETREEDAEEEPWDEDRRLEAFKSRSRQPVFSMKEAPEILKILQSLRLEIDKMRAEIPEMDHFIAGRKRAFAGADEIENEIKAAAPIVASPKVSAPPSRDSSRSRIVIETPTKRPLKPEDSPADFIRGRTLTAIAGHRNAGSLSKTSPALIPPSPTPVGRPDSLRSLSTSPSKGPRNLSPFTTPSKQDRSNRPPPISPSSIGTPEEDEIFERRMRIPAALTEKMKARAEESRAEDEDQSAQKAEQPVALEATLNHVLTNIVILQEFVLELAALMHVRASLLDGEVKFI